jgi:ribonuclease HIII
MPAPRQTTYTAPLTGEQVTALRKLLESAGFEFSPKPYTIYYAQKNKLSAAVYEKGPKLLLQGKGVEDFVSFELEPKILGEARLGYEEVHVPEMFEPHFGIDESGKGDFFGPLVIAGAFTNRVIARSFLEHGIQDSKRIGSDAKIRSLAKMIRQTPDVAIEVVQIGPERYNDLYQKFGNLNSLLGWGHARVIETLLAKNRPPARARTAADARSMRRRSWNTDGTSNSSSGRKRNRIWQSRRLRSWRVRPSSTGSSAMEDESGSRSDEVFPVR